MNNTLEPMLEHTIVGPEDAPTLVFIHGWPDDPSMWRNQVAALKAKYRCVLPVLPNFGDSKPESGGCDFTETVRRLHRTIETVSEGPVILVTHDWGAYIGYLYEKQYPEMVNNMIAMDIGGHFQPTSIKAAAMFVSYQWTLITLWLIGGVLPALGTWLTRGFARMLQVPERQASSLQVRCNYPYFYFWRSTLVPFLRNRLLGTYVPKCPVLFIYGGRKPLMFHSQQWLDVVVEHGGQHACIEKGQHWFMESHIEETNQLMETWLGERVSM